MEGMTISFQFWEGSLFSLWWKSAYVKCFLGQKVWKGCIILPAASPICGSATRVCSTFFWKRAQHKPDWWLWWMHSTTSALPGKMHLSYYGNRGARNIHVLNINKLYKARPDSFVAAERDEYKECPLRSWVESWMFFTCREEQKRSFSYRETKSKGFSTTCLKALYWIWLVPHRAQPTSCPVISLLSTCLEYRGRVPSGLDCLLPCHRCCHLDQAGGLLTYPILCFLLCSKAFHQGPKMFLSGFTSTVPNLISNVLVSERTPNSVSPTWDLQ